LKVFLSQSGDQKKLFPIIKIGDLGACKILLSNEQSFSIVGASKYWAPVSLFINK
jgi:hypothetical protein